MKLRRIGSIESIEIFEEHFQVRVDISSSCNGKAIWWRYCIRNKRLGMQSFALDEGI